MTAVCLAVARDGDPLHADLAAALRDELAALGVEATLSDGELPAPRDGLAYVLVGAPPGPLEPAQRARTVLVGTHPPGTDAYEDEVRLALAGETPVLHLLPHAARAQRRLGIAAEHAPPGWTARWEREAQGPRDIDALHVAAASWRRAAAIAGAGGPLARWRTEVRFSDDLAAPAWDLLPRARVLLCVHPDGFDHLPALEVVRGICAGVAVVGEHASGTAPLEPGRHFVGGRLETLGLLADALLDDEPGRRARADAALVAERAAVIARRPVPAAGPSSLRSADDGTATAPDDLVFPSTVGDEDASVLRAGLKDTRLELLQLGRVLRRVELAQATGRPVAPVEIVAATPARELARPRVSVLTPVYNHAEHVVAALASCAASGFTDLELVVVDDGSSDGSSAAVADWMERHPEVPALLARHPVNRGLGPARNTALDLARGELVFALDSDNEILPELLGRLVAALDADPGAAFAYSMLGMHEGERPVGLRSMVAWEPARLRSGNFIDAMALLRADAVRGLGGYSTDRRLHGWEDYDLWCRFAEHGLRGAFVAQVLARYRSSQHSMLTITDLSWRVAVSLLIDRYPAVMAGVRPPL